MVRVWNPDTGRNTTRITLEGPSAGDGSSSSSTLVWSVLMLSGHTLVTGDSLGHTQFWDVRFGTLLQV